MPGAQDLHHAVIKPRHRLASEHSQCRPARRSRIVHMRLTFQTKTRISILAFRSQVGYTNRLFLQPLERTF